jgi:hypothetical protein
MAGTDHALGALGVDGAQATLTNPLVRDIVRGHTALKHAFSRYPYIRPFRKLAQRLDERKAISRISSSK